MAINLAQKYSKQLDQVFTHGSYTEAAINNNYDFDGVKTVNVYTVTTVPTTNYNMSATGDRFGGNNEIQDVVTPYTLNNDKGFKITIDRGNQEQSNLAKKAGDVMRAQLNEQVIPEIDMERLKVAAAGATAVAQKITASAADPYGDVLKAEAFLDEAKAPVSNRYLFVTPAFYNLIKKEIVTTMNASEYNNKLLVRGIVGELDGMMVVKVPTSYFPTKTNAILWHKDAVLGAKKITSTRVITDSELIDGSVLVGRFLYGAFVLEGKKKGVASIVTA
nr:MAG TPA: Major capsid protein [Caudoviricetes sp.]